jgi:hypothetical protein
MAFAVLIAVTLFLLIIGSIVVSGQKATATHRQRKELERHHPTAHR